MPQGAFGWLDVSTLIVGRSENTLNPNMQGILGMFAPCLSSIMQAAILSMFCDYQIICSHVMASLFLSNYISNT